jgi:lipoate-protein ligase A
MQTESNIVSKVDSEILDICLEALDEVKAAYTEAQQKQNRIVELEKVAGEAQTRKIDAALVDQTIRNLVASSFLEADHSEKLASEIKKDPAVALRLVQRFIEISTPPFSEGQGVQKTASEDTNLGDPDGWSRILSKGA